MVSRVIMYGMSLFRIMECSCIHYYIKVEMDNLEKNTESLKRDVSK